MNQKNNLSTTSKAPVTAVLGGGSFGTVLANIVASNGYECRLWRRDKAEAQDIQSSRYNKKYLPEFRLHDDLTILSDLNLAVRGADVVMIAVPSGSVREVAHSISDVIEENSIIISGTKGIEPETELLMSEVIAQELPAHRVGVLSGPNLAKEIAEGHLTGSVVASKDSFVCDITQDLMASANFRIYSNTDVMGVELAGVLKNIYAILSGVAAGRGGGANTVSMMMTRGLAEMCRFASALGANPTTFLGLAGVGDLIATCSSTLSRNYQVGVHVGQGLSLSDALDKVGQTAEGVNTVKVIAKEARRLAVDMPLAFGLCEILFEGKTLDELVMSLMSRDQKEDVEYKVA